MSDALYEAEIALARAALGSPRRAAAAWRTGCFNDAMSTEIASDVLAACFVWDERGYAWEQASDLSRLARLALTADDAWFDDGTRCVGSPAWHSPIWGPLHVNTAIAAMNDPLIGSLAWIRAFEMWQAAGGRRA